jgi:hypothetical protein
VDEDLLVLFEPGVEGVPLEADRAGQAVDGVVAVEPGCAWPGGPVGPEAVKVGGPAVEALWVLLVDEQVRVHIGDRDVVLGVIGPLPHKQGPGGVEDGVVSEGGRMRRGTGSTWSTGTITCG